MFELLVVTELPVVLFESLGFLSLEFREAEDQWGKKRTIECS